MLETAQQTDQGTDVKRTCHAKYQMTCSEALNELTQFGPMPSSFSNEYH